MARIVEALGRYRDGRLSCGKAAEVLGISERHFRRLRNATSDRAMDDATSEVYSAFLVDEEGTMSTFAALCEVIAAKGLFSSLYTDRGSHYFQTPKAGGPVDKSKPTQVGRALSQLGIPHI